MYDLPRFFCMGRSWEMLRWYHLPSTRTKEPANGCGEGGNFLHQDTQASPTKVSLSGPKWLSKCTLTKRATGTNRGYVVTVCQMCQRGSVPSWAVWMAALPLSSQHLHRAPVTPTHGHSTWATAWPPTKGCSGCRQTPAANGLQRGDAPRNQGAAAGFQEPIEEPFTILFFPCCKHQLHRSDSWPGRISVDLSNFLQQSLLTKGLCKAI